MIGLTSEITDEVKFGQQDQHWHLCPQMKQVWYSTLLRGTSQSSKHAMQWLPHNDAGWEDESEVVMLTVGSDPPGGVWAGWTMMTMAMMMISMVLIMMMITTTAITSMKMIPAMMIRTTFGKGVTDDGDNNNNDWLALAQTDTIYTFCTGTNRLNVDL